MKPKALLRSVHRGLEHTGTKLCAQCGLVKPVSEFYPLYGIPGKLQSHCKLCHKLIGGVWRKKNREHVLVKQRIYVARYQRRHRKELRELGRARYRENPEKGRAKQRLYYRNNLQRIRARAHLYYLQHRKKILAQSLARYHKNKPK